MWGEAARASKAGVGPGLVLQASSHWGLTGGLKQWNREIFCRGYGLDVYKLMVSRKCPLGENVFSEDTGEKKSPFFGKAK